MARKLYRASVAAAGRVPGVMRETTIISSADTIVIGTTGRSPNTIVPAATRVMTSAPAIDSTTVAVPGGGVGTTDCRTAIEATAAAVQTVTASAPHLVLFRQNNAATSS